LTAPIPSSRLCGVSKRGRLRIAAPDKVPGICPRPCDPSLFAFTLRRTERLYRPDAERQGGRRRRGPCTAPADVFCCAKGILDEKRDQQKSRRKSKNRFQADARSRAWPPRFSATQKQSTTTCTRPDPRPPRQQPSKLSQPQSSSETAADGKRSACRKQKPWRTSSTQTLPWTKMRRATNGIVNLR